MAEAGIVLERILMGTYRPEHRDVDALNAQFFEAMKDQPDAVPYAPPIQSLLDTAESVNADVEVDPRDVSEIAPADCGNPNCVVIEGQVYSRVGRYAADYYTQAGPVRVTRTLKGASASSTALAMAAGGEMAPPSPMPFTPSGLRGDGYSRCTVSMGGSSMDVGTR